MMSCFYLAAFKSLSLSFALATFKSLSLSFALATFKSLSLSFAFENLIIKYMWVSLFLFAWSLRRFLGVYTHVFHQVWEGFAHYFFK